MGVRRTATGPRRVTSTTGRVCVTNHLGPDDIRDALRDDVRMGLVAAPKYLAPKWFYDKVGSDLFDQITRLPEYYPTEAERATLVMAAAEIVARSGASTVVELGSGSSDKTRVLLDAFHHAGVLERYVPFDVSESALAEAAWMIAERYEGVVVDAVVGDFDRHLDCIPLGDRRMLAFLGGTIGNYEPDDRHRLLRAISDTLCEGETLLLGTDLVKDEGRLIAAYDDAAGVTAAFNRNVLSVLNRELDADFVPDAFDHVALWDPDNEWIEMRLRSRSAQRVAIDALGIVVEFESGEEVRTEVSAKFRRERVESELAAVGFDIIGWWTDPLEQFAVSLSQKQT